MSYSIITKKIAISKNLLFPLTGVTKTKKEASFYPERCFLYCEDFCSIDDMELGVFYRTGNILFEKFEQNYIIKASPKREMEVEGGNLYVFDLSQYSEDIYWFLEGKYSRFSNITKQKIQYFHGDSTIESGKMPMKGHDFKIILYPEYYFEEAAKEIGVPLEYLKHSGELLSKFNIEYETFRREVVL